MLRIHIEKFYAAAGEWWTNVYHIPGLTDLSGAVSVANALYSAERAVHPGTVTFVKHRVDDMVPDTDNFITTILNTIGQYPGGTNETMAPLFAVGRVDFGVAGGGRPLRKYLRCILEGDVTGMTLVTGKVSALQTYANAVVAAGICDPQGNMAIQGAPALQVGMRQLRRGGKKKVTP